LYIKSGTLEDLLHTFQYWESTFIRWNQFSCFLQNALIHGFLEFVVSNTTVNNQQHNISG